MATPVAQVVDDLEMGGSTRSGPRASGEITMPGLVTCTVRRPHRGTVPVPTPTLPEIAALFLAMLLLGSGAYLLRRRQSGGLTPA